MPLRSFVQFTALLGLLAFLPGCASGTFSPSEPLPEPEPAAQPPVPRDRLTTVSNPDELAAVLARASLGQEQPLTAPTVGYYLDVQTASLLPLVQSGLQVTRLKDHIRLVIPGAATFDTDSATLTPEALEVLKTLADLLVEYDKTLVAIGGHSDIQGDARYNQRLSEQRARAVGEYFEGRAVSRDRLVVQGFGASQPLADNGSAEGRAANRRIELELWPLVARAEDSGSPD